MIDIIIIEKEAQISLRIDAEPDVNMQVNADGGIVLVNNQGDQILQINQDADIFIQTAVDDINMILEGTGTEVIILEGFVINEGAAADISHIEAELQMTATISRFVEFTYTGDNISAKKVYTDNTKTTQIYDVVYNYTGENLSSIDVTRVIDSFSYTKTFTYNVGGDLISIDIV